MPIDTLNTPNATPAQHKAAADYLGQCQARTHESASRLRKHLAYAEELAHTLTTRTRKR
nr:hypothetical protein [Mycobacteroides salmoniphilum]